MSNQKLYLLDGMALLFRAHYAFIKNPRITSKGLNTSALYGFTNSLLDIITKEKPTHIGVSFDTKAPTFRHEKFEAYKANRQEAPEDIVIAIPLVKQLVAAFDIPVLVMDGFEADDIIGTLAKKAAREGFDVYMMTPDKDYCQLVEENIKIYKPAYMGNPPEIMGVEKVLEKWNIAEIDQVIDILGLMGDAVDNIPGIPGVGEKTAQSLIAEFSSIENLLQNTDKLKGKLKEKVEQNKDLALMSKELATIKIDVPIEFEPEKLVFTPYDKERIMPFFEEYEFKTLTKRLFGEESASAGTPKKSAVKANIDQMDLFGAAHEVDEEEVQLPKKTINDVVVNYHLIDTVDKLKDLVSFLEIQDEFCFDTETTSVNALEANLVGMSFCYVEKEAYYIPFDSNKAETEKINILKPLLENESILKIGQNIKYDIQVMSNYGVEVKGPIFDTMLAHYIISPDEKHNMDFLSEKYLGYTPISITELIGKKGKKQGNMADLEPEELVNYACEDADITFQLKQILAKEIEKVNGKKVLDNIEFPLVRVLSEVEKNGVSVDINFLKDYSKELQKEVEMEEKNIFKEAGVEFNISSPKQLGDVLFETLKIDAKAKKTKTGQYSTNEETLMQYKNKFPIVNHILEIRELNKLKSTYIDTLPLLLSPKDHKVHTSFNQAIAATGRLSSVNPNLQNIPIRTERGREIRKAFIPSSENNLIVSADYSQVELRIMAHFSDDKDMIEAFKNGLDIHSSTASKVFGVSLEEVNSDMRRKAKMVNFGIIYGISAFGLSQRLDIPRKEASEIIDAYFTQFPSVKEFMDSAIEMARKKGYSETLFGRRRYLNDINSRNFTIRSFAERNAINAPIQGTAADIIKLAMIDIQEMLHEKKFETKMILQVHDELVFDVPGNEVDEVSVYIKNIMSGAASLKVPLEVETGKGKNWLEAH